MAQANNLPGRRCPVLILVFVLLHADLALTQVFDEPVSISSVYDVAGLPTLTTFVYAMAVFVIDRLVARPSSIISCCFGLIACEEVTGACVIDFRDSDIRDAELDDE